MAVRDPQKAQLYRRIGADIRRIRELRGMTQRELAERLAIKYQRLQHWEAGNAMPGPQELKALVDELGVSESDLLRGERAAARDIAVDIEDTLGLSQFGAVRRVPVISWVAASQFAPSGDPYPVGEGDRFELVPGVGRRCFALQVRGASMEPEFPDGTIIVVDSERAARSGDYVVVRLGDADEATLKQLRVEGGVQWLRPLNPQFPAFPMPADSAIVGVVVKQLKEY